MHLNPSFGLGAGSTYSSRPGTHRRTRPVAATGRGLVDITPTTVSSQAGGDGTAGGGPGDAGRVAAGGGPLGWDGRRTAGPEGEQTPNADRPLGGPSMPLTIGTVKKKPRRQTV
jgi:hypothetical protein